MVVSPLWRGLGNLHGFALDGKSYRKELVSLVHMQPHYYRVRQVELCHRLDEVARRW